MDIKMTTPHSTSDLDKTKILWLLS